MNDERGTRTLREVLREGLGDKWTKELEDQLFWPVSDFCDKCCNSVRHNTLEAIRKAIGITE